LAPGWLAYQSQPKQQQLPAPLQQQGQLAPGSSSCSKAQHPLQQQCLPRAYQQQAVPRQQAQAHLQQQQQGTSSRQQTLQRMARCSRLQQQLGR
jgi:hypothetical protein